MKKNISIICCLIINLIISGCGPGQLLGPTLTLTPTITPTFTPSATPTVTFTPTPTLTPTPSCSVQNGVWSGEVVVFAVYNCAITDVEFFINTGNGFLEVSMNNSIPIVNDEFQSSFTTVNTGLQSSSTMMEFRVCPKIT